MLPCLADIATAEAVGLTVGGLTVGGLAQWLLAFARDSAKDWRADRAGRADKESADRRQSEADTVARLEAMLDRYEVEREEQRKARQLEQERADRERERIEDERRQYSAQVRRLSVGYARAVTWIRHLESLLKARDVPFEVFVEVEPAQSPESEG